MKKEIGYIGLSKMGKNMVIRLLEKDWSVVAYNRTAEKVEEVVKKGAVGAESIKDLVQKIKTPRVIWLMVSHQAVDEVLGGLVPLLDRGDLIIDGGNSPYLESIRRGKDLAVKGINFLDIGTSGGPAGALNGACMMVGGKKEFYKKLEDGGFFADLCTPQGYGYMGESGTGHFVKMVHNGIEYGMMQSIAEGFDLLRHSNDFGNNFSFDLKKITDVYKHGSVITSRLVSWLQDGYKKYGKNLNAISGRASALGEGEWTVQAGKRENISMPAIQASLDVRAASQIKPSYQGKIISALRGEFGGHLVKRKDDEPEVL